MTETEKRSLFSILHQIIIVEIPDALTVEKYGGTLYTLRPDEKEGQFCGVFPYKSHVQLSFARGSELDDPEGLLGGNGKLRRHLNFENAGQVDARIIKRFLQSAAQISNGQ